MSKVILCDMDSILADFYFRILEMHQQETGVVLDPHHIDTWDKTLSGVSMYHYFSQPGFFRGLRPVPGALEVLNRLHSAGHEIVVVTAVAGLGNAPGEKFAWLKEHLPWLVSNRVFMCKEKYRIRGDVLIDDHPENASQYRLHNPEALVIGIEYPYNRDCQDAFTHLVPSFLDFPRAWRDIEIILKVRFQEQHHCPNCGSGGSDCASYYCQED
jgi:5'-nucleotidase